MKTDAPAVMKYRAEALRSIRKFFWKRRYREVDTPILTPALIPEAVIDPLETVYRDFSGKTVAYALIPSPEIWMKRLLALGSGDIFQLARSFRNSETSSGLHSPEFTMLEWYTVNAGYLDSLRLQEELCEYLRRKLKAGRVVRVRGKRLELKPPFHRVTMQQAFFEYGRIELDRLGEFEALREAAGRFAVEATPLDDWESLFHKLFLQEIEPRLPMDRPLFLLDYPVQIPTLAKKKSAGPFVERWELYAAGIELANCFTEERDPKRIREFFEHEDAVNRAQGRSVRTDWELAEILAKDLPPCSGNALGVDRLLMVLAGLDSIAPIQLFPFQQ